jgi:hypothetical protein
MSDMHRTPEPAISTEAVETLLWLAESKGIDRGRYRIVNRLRAVRNSEHFGALPEALRERVREIVADAER